MKDYLFIFIILISLLFISKKKKIYLHKDILLILIIFFTIALYKIILLGETLRVDFVRFFIFGPFIYFITFNFVRDIFLVRKIVFYMIYISIFVSFFGFYEYIFIENNKIWSIAAGEKRISSTLFSPNSLAWYLVLINTLILSQIFFFNYISKYKLITIYILNLSVIILSGSRGGFMFSIVSLLIHLLVSSTKYKIYFFRFLFLITPFFIYLYNNTLIFQGRATSTLDDSRLFLFSKVFNQLNTFSIDKILFGLSKSELNMLLQLEVLDDSFFLSIIAIFGILGFILICFLLIRMIFYLHFKLKSIFLMSLILLLLMSITGNVLYIFPHSLIFWFVLSLNNISNTNNSEHKL
jgi:hypothetical protein